MPTPLASARAALKDARDLRKTPDYRISRLSAALEDTIDVVAQLAADAEPAEPVEPEEPAPAKKPTAKKAAKPSAKEGAK